MELIYDWLVALLAEGVDRNMLVLGRKLSGSVALLAEGVDRNQHLGLDVFRGLASPSSRRAWIEISTSRAARLPLACRPPRGGRG